MGQRPSEGPLRVRTRTHRSSRAPDCLGRLLQAGGWEPFTVRGGNCPPKGSWQQVGPQLVGWASRRAQRPQADSSPNLSCEQQLPLFPLLQGKGPPGAPGQPCPQQ